MQSHDPDERALELRLLAQALLALGLPGDAQAQAAAAIALGEPARPSPELLFARQAHARALGLAGAASDGLAEMAAVVAGLESAGYSPTALELLRARRIRAELLARSGELARATAELEAVAAAPAAAPSGQPLELAQTLDLLGSVLRSSGLATQALATHERARLLWSEHLPVDHPWALRNALYRAVLAQHAELASTDELPMHYKSRFPATSVWRVTIDRCLGSQARAAPGAADCALFL